MRSSIHFCAYCNPPSPWFEWCVQWDEIDHTTGETPLNFLKSHVGSFTSSLNWLMRRWKRPGQLLTSLPNEMVIWAKEKNKNYMIFPALRPWLVVWPGFEPSSSHSANSSGALPTKLTGKQLAKLEGATQYNQVEIHTSSEMLGAVI